MITLPIHYLQDGDRIALLPDADQLSAWEATVKAGLASEDPSVVAEAEATQQAIAEYRKALQSDKAVHRVVVFRTPTWADKPALYAEALRLADEAGSRDAVNAFLIPLRVQRLLDHVEDLDGNTVTGDHVIPEALFDRLGQRLEPYLYASASLTDFFGPAGKPTAEAKKVSRKPTSAPAK